MARASLFDRERRRHGLTNSRQRRQEISVSTSSLRPQLPSESSDRAIDSSFEEVRKENRVRPSAFCPLILIAADRLRF